MFSFPTFQDLFSGSPLPRLRSLSLSGSELLSAPLPNGLLCPLSATLASLNLSSCGLRAASDAGLGSGGCAMAALRRLDLSRNRIVRLPREGLGGGGGGAAPGLEELDLSGNGISLVDDG